MHKSEQTLARVHLHTPEMNLHKLFVWCDHVHVAFSSFT